MGKGGSAKVEVNEYRMSIHFGICAEMDAITGIYVGEKQAWAGNISTLQAFTVSAPELFGGQKKEGGVGGVCYFLPGSDDQVMPSNLAAKRSLTSSTHPAYRGLASIYMTGSGSTEGFWWGNTAYMQGVWFRGRRAPKGLAPIYAMIGNRVEATFSGFQVTVGGSTATLSNGVAAIVGGHTVSYTHNSSAQTDVYTLDGLVITFAQDGGGSDGESPSVTVIGQTVTNPGGTLTVNGITIEQGTGSVKFSFGSAGQDANPAHIIYECLTNTSWGMGANDDVIDRQNFETTARTLYHEGFGLSLLWTRESSIQDFINEIIDHIQAVLYVDPSTGKLTLKLLRDDYDGDLLPVIDEDNAVLSNYQRKLWAEAVNEIVVTWTNPVNEQEETVTFQDLGNITVQGGVVSSSRNYYGIRNAALAQRVAQRDTRQSAAPLASVEAELDRTQWSLRPGSVVRLRWPEYDIINLVMRVTSIDYGKTGSSTIRVSLLEDIFSLEDATYNAAPRTGWIDPAADPTPMDYVRIITSPAYFSTRRLSAADAAALEYPDVLVNILASSANPDANFYELVGQSVLPNGDIVAEEKGTRTPIGYAAIPTALPEEATTVVPSFGNVVGGTVPTTAGFCFIGNASERIMEIALIESVSEAGWVLRRGVLDTVPRAWPAGTGIWFYDIRFDFFDTDTYGDGETVNYKLLTLTSKGRLPLNSAPITGAILTARPHLPNRPANVIVGGVAFGPVDLTDSSPTSVTVTWANRNRTMEDGVVVKWDDANVIPETGQTTTIRVVATDGTVLATHAGLTGTSYTLPVSDWGANYEADVVVSAARDGFESLQSTARRVRLRAPGYGDGYGDGYGGPGAGYTPPPVTPPPPPPDEPYEPVDDFPQPWEPPCLALGARYLLANDDRTGPGETCRGDELVAGETWLWTRHIETGEWGAYKVGTVSLHEQQLVYAAPGLPAGTPGHLFWLAQGWSRLRIIGEPCGRATVVRVTVPDATTYTTVNPDGSWIVSHNIKQTQIT